MRPHTSIAGERSWHNRHSKTRDGVLRDRARIDEEGVLGERAFAEAFNLDPEKIESRKPVQFNFRLNDGTRVDVRASKYRGAKLCVPPHIAKRDTIDVYVLVEVDREAGTGRLIGWATADEVRAAEVRAISRRPGAPPQHVVYPTQLHAIDELRKHHEPHTLPLFG